ncbi:Origin recognition complex subunit 3 [Frankliniella fusca]|uniref:Origin recognition complex subunit 3 n=1 Tax=Frankliniella fusca TaxID=407009 RepID=A0AAE1H6W4_9NEOP|nr:Origin recognition complex subunit 3 [Frankliniella fusca]
MDSTVSVSKGCFAFKRKKRNQGPTSARFSGQSWYKAYRNSLTSSEELLNVLENQVFDEIFGGLIDYISTCTSGCVKSHCEIPAATLLTGVNMPDHSSLFSTLSKKVSHSCSPHVATLWSRDCSSLKASVERMCSQFMLVPANEETGNVSSDDEEEGEAESQNKRKVQRWNFNLKYLVSWYNNFQDNPLPQKKKKATKILPKSSSAKPLVVIIPDFESFTTKVLQELILLLKVFQPKLPFVLVLGVATAVSAVHRVLPHHVSCCLRMKVFHSQPSLAYLNEVLEKVFFLPNRPFHLGGKTFKLLMDVFLFHDFSVMGFIQGFKYCMSQHFFDKDWTALSCMPDELPSAAKHLSKTDIESVRKLPSIRKHIESLSSRKDQIAWITDDNFVKGEIVKLLTELHKYIEAFFTSLKCLNLLTSDLPGAPLEKHLRSVYVLASTCDIVKSQELKEGMKLLSLSSSDELESKLKEVLCILHEAVKNGAQQLETVTKKIDGFLPRFKTLWMPSSPTKSMRSPLKSPSKSARSPLKSPVKSPLKSPLQSPSKILTNISSRSQFREKLREMKDVSSYLSPFEKLRTEVLTCLLEDLFTTFLVSPQTKPLHEVLFFDDVSSVKSYIIGSQRQALLRGLRDPHFYLDCNCCKLSDLGDILPTLPDVSIVYKLHLESGKLINMFDWMQSFLTITNPSTSFEEQTEVDPKLQARFTRAVAELQFLGFIKSSNRKTDHVTRLTWC